MNKWVESTKNQISILWIGQVILMAMLAMSAPYWPLYIKTLGQFSAQEVRYWSAAIYIAPFISSILISPLWGKLGDRHGYKPMVMRACLGLFITQALILCSKDVRLIFIFRFLQGGLAGFIVAAQAWALAISDPSMRGSILGQLQSATAMGNLIGPLMGGLIAVYMGYLSIFKVSAIICAFITIVFGYFLKNPPLNTSSSSQNIQEEKKEEVLSQKPHFFILMILITIGIIQIAKVAILPVFSLFVIEKLGGNEIMVGVLYASTGLMIWLTASHWGQYFDKFIKTKKQTYTLLITLSLICAGLQILHAYLQTTWGILILRLCWGICLAALLPLLLKILISKVDKQAQGMWIGFGNSATKFGNLIGILLGVLVETYLGYTSGFLMIAACYFVTGIFFLGYLIYE